MSLQPDGSGVARSLLLGGQGASVASRHGGPGPSPGKIFGDHGLETLGKRGKRPCQLYFASST